ncbi:MAG: hypothetical protein IT416_00135 [Candidatus Pacebacteria bacterium]|nr:hypothetical protein [Candidatus Paceibacterota bacterium]
MKRVFLSLAVLALLLNACTLTVGDTTITLFEVSTTEESALPAQPASVPVDDGFTTSATDVGFTRDMVKANNLVNPELHHSDDNPAGDEMGYHDIGVNDGQIGLVFAYHITWDGTDLGGGGCDMTVLTPGWYENVGIEDGRFEVYDVPSSDYPGWVEVLVAQRVEEQADHYGCPTTDSHVRLFMSKPSVWKTFWSSWH